MTKGIIGRVIACFVITPWLFLSVDGLTCYQCRNSYSSTGCHTTTNCSADESCFTETFLNNNATIRYKSGCMSFRDCLTEPDNSVPTGNGGSATTSTGHCRECCGVDNCNTNMCSSTIAPRKDAGHWNHWSTWSSCSATCGIGQRHRQRTCSLPHPLFPGDNCQGDTKDTRACFAKACADGGWSQWSSWDRCSATFGAGLQKRHRACNNPTPSRFGKACEGDTTDTRICSLASCYVNGHWARWTKWSSCSQTCGYSMRERTRTCTSPAPPALGRDCNGNNKDVSMCQGTNPCPVDGHWSKWSRWKRTTFAHCTRTRTCIGKYFGGRGCSGEAKQEKQYTPHTQC